MPMLNEWVWRFVATFLGPSAVAGLRAMRTVARVDSGTVDDEPGMQVISRYVHGDDVCMDIGASYGRFAYKLAKMGARVYAIEPTPHSSRSLRRIAESQGLARLSVHEVALGAAAGTETMVIPDQVNQRAFLRAPLPDASPFDLGRAGQVKVEVTTLDEFVREQGLTKLDFIKCDIEGAELDVFRGGERVLRNMQPLIWCEIEDRHTRKYRHTADDVFRYIHELDYLTYVSSADGILQAAKKPSEDFNDYLLVPQSKVKGF